MTLHVVPDPPPTPVVVPFDVANREFQTHWAAARNACAATLTALGSLATPLYRSDTVGRVRIETALHAADQAARNARQVIDELTACLDLHDRAGGRS